jgi:hypothetical protein
MVLGRKRIVGELGRSNSDKAEQTMTHGLGGVIEEIA